MKMNKLIHSSRLRKPNCSGLMKLCVCAEEDNLSVIIFEMNFSSTLIMRLCGYLIIIIIIIIIILLLLLLLFFLTVN